MALTTNQIQDIVQTQLGRAPTDYELSKFATASPQTLATLKDTYGKLNTTSSISDYLTSIGQDNSPEARAALASKYGISNSGTAEGNTALLNALKSGKTPSTTPVTGAITPAVTPANPIDKSQPYNDGTGIVMPGSVAGAAGTSTQTPVSDGTINTDPNVVRATKNYEDAYTEQQTKQQAIAEIDQILASSLQDRKDQIAKSGGSISEAQLYAELHADTNPLIAQRKQLVSEYTAANSNYQKALKDKTDAESNFVKQSQLNISQEKVDVQQQQFAQKLEASGYKPMKVNITDSAGNVLGQSIQTWVNPANKNLGVTSDGTNVALSTDKGGNQTATPIGNNSLPTVGSKDTPPKNVTIANGFTPTMVYQSLISGPDKQVKGQPGVPVTQEMLYNWAIDAMMGVQAAPGTRMPTTGGIPSLVQAKRADIMKAYGLDEMTVNIYKAQYGNLIKTNATLLQRTSLLNIAANSALDNLDLAIKASANVPRGGAKIVNQWSQYLSGNFTPNAALAGLDTAIYTYGREYAKVTSGSYASISGLTDSAQQEVDKLISAAQSPEAFASVTEMMKKDMQNVVNENAKAVDSFPAAVTKLYGFAGGQGSTATPTTVQSNGQSYNVGQVYNDGTANWTVDAQGNWTKQ